ncbi:MULTISPECIES: CatB-related O-acetyltransferase [unclassified Lentimonas]|uniref:CatB-related O-acetyltransferase n=1 Tax=unclassified Lentimonas TaxID=2630993 RepID=UPI001389EA2F|nr:MULTISPECIES: CatB-related O-acetyltransferase [unclassified Lentimonas]
MKLCFSSNAFKAIFEGRSKIYPLANVRSSKIGFGSYIGPRSFLPSSHIGRYCSIGPDVMLLPGTHPLDGRLSTHPCFYSKMGQSGFTYADKQLFEEFSYVDDERSYYLEVGNDVWIGARAIIVGGVRIGHGAVIGAGAIVNKNVDDYSIVAGVPAKHIRYRFSESKRGRLLAEKWWENDEKWIRENLDRFEPNNGDLDS